MKNPELLLCGESADALEDASAYGMQPNSRYWNNVPAENGKTCVGPGVEQKRGIDLGQPQTCADRKRGPTRAQARMSTWPMRLARGESQSATLRKLQLTAESEELLQTAGEDDPQARGNCKRRERVVREYALQVFL